MREGVSDGGVEGVGVGLKGNRAAEGKKTRRRRGTSQCPSGWSRSFTVEFLALAVALGVGGFLAHEEVGGGFWIPLVVW